MPKGAAMRQANAHMLAIAERLAAFEFKENGSAPRVSSPGIAACEKLRAQLSTLMGNAGFGAMLVRSVALAKQRLPEMSELELRSDGTVTELDPAELKANLPALSRSGIFVLAELLGLLVAFIGEPLVVGMVQEIWPKFALSGLEKAQEKNEKTK
jgi:hypothetical protein